MLGTLLVLLAATLAPTPQEQDGAALYRELVAVHQEALRAAGSSAPVAPLLPDESPLHGRFLEAARQQGSGDGALPFLGWLLKNAPRNERVHAAAVAAIEERARAAGASGLDDEQKRFKASKAAVGGMKYKPVSDEAFARALLEAKTLALFASSDEIRAASERSVFKLERLQMGMLAPDIVARDLDGVEFKLSDYRGKVVVLDFWGDW